MRTSGFYILLILLVAPCLAQDREMRKWTSDTGSYSIEARLLGFVEDGLQLRTADGRDIVVPLEKLSDDDKHYARNEYRDTDTRASFGFTFTDLRDVRSKYKDKDVKLPSTRTGVFVIDVVPSGPAYAAGIQEADVITRVNGQIVKDMNSISDIGMTLKAHSQYEISFCRMEERDGRVIWPKSDVKIRPITAKELKPLVDAYQKEIESQCPIEIVAGLLDQNSIGTPELTLKIRNNSSSDATAYVIEADCYNNFGDKVKTLGHGSHVYRGIGQQAIKSRSSRNCTWTLHLQDTTTRVITRVVRAKLADGTEWTSDGKDVPEYEFTKK